MMDKGYKGVFSKMGEGLLEKFIEDLKRELQERPEDSELLFKLGVAYSRAGKDEEAYGHSQGAWLLWKALPVCRRGARGDRKAKGQKVGA